LHESVLKSPTPPRRVKATASTAAGPPHGAPAAPGGDGGAAAAAPGAEQGAVNQPAPLPQQQEQGQQQQQQEQHDQKQQQQQQQQAPPEQGQLSLADAEPAGAAAAVLPEEAAPAAEPAVELASPASQAPKGARQAQLQVGERSGSSPGQLGLSPPAKRARPSPGQQRLPQLLLPQEQPRDERRESVAVAAVADMAGRAALSPRRTSPRLRGSPPGRSAATGGAAFAPSLSACLTQSVGVLLMHVHCLMPCVLASELFQDSLWSAFCILRIACVK
jgi:hypothetical protein